MICNHSLSTLKKIQIAWHFIAPRVIWLCVMRCCLQMWFSKKKKNALWKIYLNANMVKKVPLQGMNL